MKIISAALVLMALGAPAYSESYLSAALSSGIANIERDVSDQSGRPEGSAIAFGTAEYSGFIVTAGHYIHPNLAIEAELMQPGMKSSYDLDIVDQTGLTQTQTMRAQSRVNYHGLVHLKPEISLGDSARVYLKAGYSHLNISHRLTSLPGKPGTHETEGDFSYGAGASFKIGKDAHSFVEWRHVGCYSDVFNAGIRVHF